MESRSVSIAWKIMLIPLVVGLFFAILFTFFTDAVLNMGFEPFTGQSWSTFVSISPKMTYEHFVWLVWNVRGGAKATPSLKRRVLGKS